MVTRKIYTNDWKRKNILPQPILFCNRGKLL